MAVLLHVVLLGSMVIAFDFSRSKPMTPMMITGSVVEEIPDKAPPPPVVKQEPIPDPVVEEPPPDNSEELQREAETEKRRLDALIEADRLEKLRLQESEDKKRKEREEEEKEQKRVEAEQQRQEDIERQQEENERLRRELENEQRNEEIEAEERRQTARNSSEMDAYVFAVGQKIRRNWAVPASANSDTVCSVRVRQLPTGEVVGVNILSCNGDDAVRRSVEAAIRRSSPLPQPQNRDLFDPNLRLNLSPDPDS
jgi:colicin import membrane protein